MDSVDKLWSEVDSLKESRIRHDERIRVAQEKGDMALSSIKELEGQLNSKFDSLTAEIREGFKVVGMRIDEIEGSKREHKGYEAAQKETRVAMLKQFALWVSIVGLGASFIFWLLTRGAS